MLIGRMDHLDGDPGPSAHDDRIRVGKAELHVAHTHVLDDIRPRGIVELHVESLLGEIPLLLRQIERRVIGDGRPVYLDGFIRLSNLLCASPCS